MRFAGCHARITRSNPTGMSSSDIIQLVTGIYYGVVMGCLKDDCGKQFKFLAA